MPLPKRRFSRSRRDKRRLQLNLTVPALGRCSHCGASVLSHRICPSCGWYRGREAVSVQSKEKKEGR